MGDDRAIQVIQYRTFLQPQGLDYGQSAPQTDTPPCCGNQRRSSARARLAQNAFHMVVRGLDTFDRCEQPQRRIQCQEIVQKVAALESAQEQPCSKTPWSSARSGPTGLAVPVGPTRRDGTPTSRRTDIPRPPDPPGQLLQRALLDRPVSESRVSGGPSRLGAGSAAACRRPTSGR